MDIRRYEPQDAAATEDVFYRSVHEVAARNYTREQLGAWAPLNRPIEAWGFKRGSRPTWVAVEDAAVVGFTDLIVSGRTGHVDMLFVHPDYQRRGVAAALLGVVLAHASGLDALTTEASITARPFFEARGFTVVEPQLVSVNGQLLRNFRMRRELRVVDEGL